MTLPTWLPEQDWADFKAGTSVRLKRTFLGQGRTPAVTITTIAGDQQRY